MRKMWLPLKTKSVTYKIVGSIMQDWQKAIIFYNRPRNKAFPILFRRFVSNKEKQIRAADIAPPMCGSTNKPPAKGAAIQWEPSWWYCSALSHLWLWDWLASISFGFLRTVSIISTIDCQSISESVFYRIFLWNGPLV